MESQRIVEEAKRLRSEMRFDPTARTIREQPGAIFHFQPRASKNVQTSWTYLGGRRRSTSNKASSQFTSSAQQQQEPWVPGGASVVLTPRAVDKSWTFLGGTRRSTSPTTVASTYPSSTVVDNASPGQRERLAIAKAGLKKRVWNSEAAQPPFALDFDYVDINDYPDLVEQAAKEEREDAAAAEVQHIMDNLLAAGYDPAAICVTRDPVTGLVTDVSVVPREQEVAMSEQQTAATDASRENAEAGRDEVDVLPPSTPIGRASQTRILLQEDEIEDVLLKSEQVGGKNANATSAAASTTDDVAYIVDGQVMRKLIAQAKARSTSAPVRKSHYDADAPENAVKNGKKQAVARKVTDRAGAVSQNIKVGEANRGAASTARNRAPVSSGGKKIVGPGGKAAPQGGAFTVADAKKKAVQNKIESPYPLAPYDKTVTDRSSKFPLRPTKRVVRPKKHGANNRKKSDEDKRIRGRKHLTLADARQVQGLAGRPTEMDMPGDVYPWTSASTRRDAKPRFVPEFVMVDKDSTSKAVAEKSTEMISQPGEQVGARPSPAGEGTSNKTPNEQLQPNVQIIVVADQRQREAAAPLKKAFTAAPPVQSEFYRGDGWIDPRQDSRQLKSALFEDDLSGGTGVVGTAYQSEQPPRARKSAGPSSSGPAPSRSYADPEQEDSTALSRAGPAGADVVSTAPAQLAGVTHVVAAPPLAAEAAGQQNNAEDVDIPSRPPSKSSLPSVPWQELPMNVIVGTDADEDSPSPKCADRKMPREYWQEKLGADLPSGFFVEPKEEFEKVDRFFVFGGVVGNGGRGDDVAWRDSLRGQGEEGAGGGPDFQFIGEEFGDLETLPVGAAGLTDLEVEGDGEGTQKGNFVEPAK